VTAPASEETDLDRLYEPVWAGAWVWVRWMWVVAALWGHVPRVFRVEDAYAVDDMLFTSGPYRLVEWVVFTPPTAYALWALGMIGIALVAWGGRLMRPGIAMFLVGAGALLLEEALNIKAHDRLMLFVTLGLLFSPAAERDLQTKWRSPFARYWMLIVYSAIYGSTGLMKLLYEPGWFDGTALQYHLVQQFHAGSHVAAFVSGQRWLTFILCWWTVLFELGFPLLVWFRKTNPWVLALGMGFHVGIFSLMDVGAFGFVSAAAYPVLLHPDVAQALDGWIRTRWARLRGQEVAISS
jgi:hypothetical protein